MSESGPPVIREGPDWLQLPEVQALLPPGLQLQHVPCRHSYAGKAWPSRGVVRMVRDGAPPVRWLLTLLHELAHLADFRGRVADWEQQHRRRFAGGSRQLHQLWRSEAPHGERWRLAFMEQVEEAIAAGLLPGNEQAARAHARSGRRCVEEAALDLQADPRVQWSPADATAPGPPAGEPVRLPVGEVVHFDGGPQRGLITGQLVRHNLRSCTVLSGQTKWYVPPGLLRPGAAPPPTPENSPTPAPSPVLPPPPPPPEPSPRGPVNRQFDF